MGRFRHDAFGQALSRRLDEIGYSLDRAVEKWPETNKAMLSRARRGDSLSVDSVLTICKFAGLDPFAFLGEGKRRRVTMKSIADQFVTEPVSRETAEQ